MRAAARPEGLAEHVFVAGNFSKFFGTGLITTSRQAYSPTLKRASSMPVPFQV